MHALSALGLRCPVWMDNYDGKSTRQVWRTQEIPWDNHIWGWLWLGSGIFLPSYLLLMPNFLFILKWVTNKNINHIWPNAWDKSSQQIVVVQCFTRETLLWVFPIYEVNNVFCFFQTSILLSPVTKNWGFFFLFVIFYENNTQWKIGFGSFRISWLQ